MNVEQYQEEVNKTRSEVYKLSTKDIIHHELAVVTACLGLCSEAGELATMVKKSVEKSRHWDHLNACEEIGDCLWYLAQICNLLDIDLAKIFQANFDKLQKRHPNGYNPNYEEGKECGA